VQDSVALTATSAEIASLLDSYREARAAILALPDRVEREIGLATHRLEFRAFERTLSTSAVGVDEAARRALKEYAAELEGGEAAETAIDWLDGGARKVLKDLTASLVGGVGVGVFVFAAGLAAVAFDAAEATGELVVQGVVVLLGLPALGWFMIHLGRALAATASGAEAAMIASFGWAGQLGRAADAAMSTPRTKQAAVWHAATGQFGYHGRPFTEKARHRAELLVWAAWLLVAAGLCLIAYETYEAFARRTSPQLPPLGP
jgi:hypothetical protein